MSTSRALLTELEAIGAAIETTTGSAATVGQAQTFWAISPKVIRDAKTTRRKNPSHMGDLPGIPGMNPGKVSLKTWLTGSGSSTDPAWASVLLACSGLPGSDHAYAPTSTPINTATIKGYFDGRTKSLVGCMGRTKLTAKVGDPAELDWEFMGVWVPGSGEASASLVTPTPYSVTPPPVLGATFTIGGTAYPFAQLSLEINTKIILRKTATTSSGLVAAAIVGREILVKVDPEALPFATQDWNSVYDPGTTLALNLVIGSATWNTITIAAPYLQLSEAPNEGDREGTITDELTFVATQSAGDDEVSITLS